ncbi:MAG: hypothetical protein R3F14_36415 [Polyangiaceae bacterium]
MSEIRAQRRRELLLTLGIMDFDVFARHGADDGEARGSARGARESDDLAGRSSRGGQGREEPEDLTDGGLRGEVRREKARSKRSPKRGEEGKLEEGIVREREMGLL